MNEFECAKQSKAKQKKAKKMRTKGYRSQSIFQLIYMDWTCTRGTRSARVFLSMTGLEPATY